MYARAALCAHTQTVDSLVKPCTTPTIRFWNLLHNPDSCSIPPRSVAAIAIATSASDRWPKGSLRGRGTSKPTKMGPDRFVGELLLQVAAWAAAQELEAIRRRTKAGLDRARDPRRFGSLRRSSG